MNNPIVRAIGVDAGSTTVKLVAVDADGHILWHLLEGTEPKLEEQARRMMAQAVEKAGTPLDGMNIVATGYGRNLIPDTRRRVTEITCHAKGIFRTTGHAGTLIDIGGQDSKVIVIGKEGNVSNFVMNDKCAAGTGRFLEVSAARLRIELGQLGQVAMGSPEEVPISSTCTVFAESEIVSLIARGHPTEHIVRGLVRSLIRRVASLARSAGLCPPVMLSGGVARNAAIGAFLAEELGQEVFIPDQPQLMGALGAALISLEEGQGSSS